MKNESGFTIVEVVISVMMISIGAVGIASATGGMTRMISRGDVVTTSSFYAQERMEQIRATDCANMANGTESHAGGYSVTWTVQSGTNSASRLVTVRSQYRGDRGARADTIQTVVSCI